MKFIIKVISLIYLIFFLIQTNQVYASTNDYKVEYNFNFNYEKLEINKDYHFKIELKNSGNASWDNENIFFSYHWLNKDGKVIIWDGIRTPLSKDINKNEITTLMAKIKTPNISGEYFLILDMVHENETWFSNIDDENQFKLRVKVDKIYNSNINMINKKKYVFEKDESHFLVKIKNISNEIWDINGNYNLSYHWVSENGNPIIWDGIRTSLGKNVKPGEEVELEAKVITPDRPGKYILQWDLVQENVTWFSEVNRGNLENYNIVVLSKKLKYVFYIIATFVIILFYLFLKRILKNKSNQLPNSFKIILKVIRFIKYLVKDIFKSYNELIWFFLAIFLKLILFSKMTGVAINLESNKLTISVLVIILILLSLIYDKKVRFFVVYVLNIFFTLIIISDLVYWRYFGDVLSIQVLKYASQANAVSSSIKELFNIKDIIFILDLIFGIVLYKLYKKQVYHLSKKPKFKYVISTILVFLILFSIPVFSKVSEIKNQEFGIYKQRFYNRLLVEDLGLINYHIFDAFKYVSGIINKPKASFEDKVEISEWFQNHQTLDKTAPYFGIAKNKNILIIQEESLQNFVVDLRINGAEVTPNLNKLKKEAIYYENYFDQTNQGRTSGAEFTSLNSLYPLQSGSVYFEFAGNKFNSLPNILIKEGYSTFSAHPYNADFWNRKVMHRNLGFENSYFKDDFKNDEIVGMGLSDESFFKQSIEKIKSTSKPFFSFLITLSNHHPYKGLPLKYKELDIGKYEGTLLGDYLHSVHYADKALGTLIEELKNEGLYEETLIIIYGDHDAGLPNKDILEIQGRQDTTHTVLGNFEIDKVPMLIRIPQGKISYIDNTYSGHLDLTPTLLHLLGHEHNEYQMGRNLFSNEKEDLVVFRNGSFISENKAFITLNGLFENGTAYDLQNKKEIPIYSLLSTYEDSRSSLIISDIILSNDLLPELEEINSKRNN